MKSLALLLSVGIASVAAAQEDVVPDIATPKSTFSGDSAAPEKPRALKVITAKDREEALKQEQARQQAAAESRVAREKVQRREKEVAELEAYATQADELRAKWLEEEQARDEEAAKRVKLPKEALAAPAAPAAPTAPPARKVLIPGAATGP